MYRLLLLLCISSALALPPKGRLAYKPDGRIINGEVAGKGQFPWQVAVTASSIFGSWFCGGSLISNKWVLTAAHCVEDARSFTLYLGTNTLTPDAGALTITSTSYIKHEQYNDNTLQNDVALIELPSAVTLNEHIQTIAVGENTVAAGQALTVSGWGLTSDSSSSVSNILNYVGLVSISNAQCGNYYGYVEEAVICSSYSGSQVKSTCGGDSGGPLVIGSGSNAVLVGVVSFGSIEGCESGAPSGYSRTSYFRDWIRRHSGV